MNIFDTLFPEHLYHSYIIFSGEDNTSESLVMFLQQAGHIQPSSPDVISQVYDSFTINDVAFVKDWTSNKSLNQSKNDKRVCIISAKFINREAEHALLKLLEEPATDTHFFIILPPGTVLLDTILSRVQIVHVDQNIDQNKNSQKFLTLKPEDRIEYIGTLIKKHEKDDTSGGLRHDAMELINYIEQEMHGKIHRKVTEHPVFIFQELENAREYLSTPGASVKMILEHIALVI